MELEKILGKLKPFENKTVLVSNYQDSTDIIDEILKAHLKYKNEYDKISSYFWKGNLKSSLQYVFNYLKNNVTYIIESDSKQTVKSPAAIIAQGYGDCKHYSLFTAGLIDSWRRTGKKIDWAYRFANYKLFARTPHHVFVVVNPGTKHEIWIDPVLNNFDEQKPYINKIDKNYKQMALYSISGTADEIGARNFRQLQLNKIFRLLKMYKARGYNLPTSKFYTRYIKLAKRYNMFKKRGNFNGFDENLQLNSVAGFGCCGDDMSGFVGTTSIDGIGRKTRKERKARRKARRLSRREGANCKGRLGAKIALSLARRAYLLLVRLNFKKLGVKTHLALQNPTTANKIYKKWCNLGGKASLLRSTARKAYEKAKRKGKVSGDFDTSGTIGVEPTTLAALWAQAQPVMAALSPLLALASQFLPKGSKAAEVAQTASEASNAVSGSFF